MPAAARIRVVTVSERWRFSERVICGDTTIDSRMIAAAAPSVRALASLARSWGPLGHGRGQRPEGNVDQAVDQAEQRVAEIGVDQLAAGGEPSGHGEQRDAQQHERRPAEEKIRAEPAPPGGGLVDHPAGEDVGDGLPHPHHQQQRPSRAGGDAGDVGVVQQQEHRRQREGEVVGDVPTGIAQVLGQAQPASLLRFGRRRGG
jgi:hypothetical protein